MSDYETLCTVAHQDPLSMEFSRQEYQRVAISFTRVLLNPGKPSHPAFQADSLPSELAGFHEVLQNFLLQVVSIILTSHFILFLKPLYSFYMIN